MASRRLPVLVRFLAMHALIGFGLAALFVGAIVASDFAGLGRLLLRAEGHPGPLLLLWYFLGLTLGSVQMAAAVMLLGKDDDGNGGGGRREGIVARIASWIAPPRRALRPVAVPVPVRR